MRSRASLLHTRLAACTPKAPLRRLSMWLGPAQAVAASPRRPAPCIGLHHAWHSASWHGARWHRQHGGWVMTGSRAHLNAIGIAMYMRAHAPGTCWNACKPTATPKGETTLQVMCASFLPTNAWVTAYVHMPGQGGQPPCAHCLCTAQQPGAHDECNGRMMN